MFNLGPCATYKARKIKFYLTGNCNTVTPKKVVILRPCATAGFNITKWNERRLDIMKNFIVPVFHTTFSSDKIGSAVTESCNSNKC